MSIQPATAAPVSHPVGLGLGRGYWRTTFLAYLYLLPAVLILGTFHFFPIFYAFYVSLNNWGLVNKGFVGLDNYRQALTSPDLWNSVLVTFSYALGTVPITLILSTICAYLLFKKIRGLAIYRTTYFLPYVTSTVGAAAVWTWLFHSQFGPINVALGAVGIHGLRWLQEPQGVFTIVGRAFGMSVPAYLSGPSLALVAIMVVAVWHSIGFDIAVLLAGLGNISTDLLEAGRIDGANELQIFRLIIVPLLMPTVFFLIVISTIGSLQTFNEIYVMSSSVNVGSNAGGPLHTTESIVVNIYNQFYSFHRVGYGSAVAFILFGIILVFTLVEMRLIGRRVDY
jgi:multiple sugar transport system permease protein